MAGHVPSPYADAVEAEYRAFEALNRAANHEDRERLLAVWLQQRKRRRDLE
jgi:hypothetical protein